MAYLHFITISFRFDPDYVDMYFEVCRAVLSSGEEQDVSKPDKDLLAAEIAFRQENHGNKDATGPVLEQVRAYCDAYNSVDYMHYIRYLLAQVELERASQFKNLLEKDCTLSTPV